ncbi:transcriptional adapter 3-like isoform X2 [Varroa jacobsoni]|uniref:Transcriptional adapter 3 n=1 Tax=Varroa destructor TaxID=109461 RepID=A0A7M7JWX8_VARDE|nr:transcriptional adapter 3-like isoform X2 [Varroa destructor]XP_022702433.1 transcriptional adapter 3-like isoform X2 [Varroa jacobsoni]
MKVSRASKPCSSGGSSENTSDSLEDELSTQQELPIIDVRDQCPKYAAIVDGRLGKLELETLLVAVVQRKQQLREQLEALDHDEPVTNRDRNRLERDKGEKHRASSPLQGGSQSKRARPNTAEHKSAKKSSKDKYGKSGLAFGIEVVTENVSHDAGATVSPEVMKGPKEPGGQAGKAGVPPLPSNDAPHQFWAYLGEYCKPLSDEHIQVLENLLEAQEAIKSSDYVKVPALGTHYTVKWAEDDLLEEQREAASDASTVRLIENVETVLHQTTKESLSDERYGTLTQRLMSCLIEENVIGFSRDKLPIVVPQRQTVSSSSAASIEQRIRRELEELGVMQSPAQKAADQDDEVFLELRRCQSQLISISAQNVRMLHALLEAARRRQVIQKLEGRLRQIDNDILEHFWRRRNSARSSRSSSLTLPPPSKQDREQLRALLDERKAIAGQLDALSAGEASVA